MLSKIKQLSTRNKILGGIGAAGMIGGGIYGISQLFGDDNPKVSHFDYLKNNPDKYSNTPIIADVGFRNAPFNRIKMRHPSKSISKAAQFRSKYNYGGIGYTKNNKLDHIIFTPKKGIKGNVKVFSVRNGNSKGYNGFKGMKR